MINYSQGDVVYLNDPSLLPDLTELTHPFVIISSDVSNRNEKWYTGLMMTSSAQKDKFTFPCDNIMFESPLKKDNCQIRIYLTTSFPESYISKLYTKMKKQFLKNLIEDFKDLVLNCN